MVDGSVKGPEPRNRMREIFKSGSVGRAPGGAAVKAAILLVKVQL